jgi:threonine aldolase
MNVVDLRSDTVTKPSAKMRQAMAEATVGDDCYEEDPTVNELQDECARVLGKEAALFVPSGTMGNLACVLAHCERGDEAIVGDEAHIFFYELGGATALGGVVLRTIPNRAGSLDPDEVGRAIHGNESNGVRTALLCLENSHNRGGGRCITPEQTRALASVAHARGIAVHVDGARLFNAAVALGVEPAILAAYADSVSVCFSKGLGAPVGSAIAGTTAFVARCRRLRRMLGGGMRQAGVLAAAALIALRDGPKRLWVDHENAKAFHLALEELGPFEARAPQTNIVLFSPRVAAASHPRQLLAEWRRAGVLVNHVGAGTFRAVTHVDAAHADVVEAAGRLSEALKV